MTLLSRTNKSRRINKKTTGLFWTICSITFVILMILKPEIVFNGATKGLNTWWNIVFPSLLPFFIVSELLMSFGLVGFMGILLEPLMRPLFNVPGCGSFVFCVGYTSGYPISAMITGRLRSKGLCTRIEAERLISFTSNSSPLFLIVAVSVGMFGKPELAFIIAGAHYLANITLGLLLRFYGRKDPERPVKKPVNINNLFSRALRELLNAWEKEKRPPGKIIGDATRNSINNLISIGGFIILFSVIIQLLTATGFISGVSQILGIIFLPLGFSPEVLPSISSGIFELTIGTKMISETTTPIMQQVIISAIILGWSGLSAQTQVASMISDTDIRILPYIISRIGQALIAALYTVLFFKTVGPASSYIAVPALATLDKIQGIPPLVIGLQLSGVFILSIISLTFFAVVYNAILKLKSRF